MQRQEPLFENIYRENLAKQENEVVNPRLVETTPTSEVREGILYRVDRAKAGKEILQIMVP